MHSIQDKQNVQQQRLATTQNTVIQVQLPAQVELGVLVVERRATSAHLDTYVHPQFSLKCRPVWLDLIIHYTIK